MRIPPPRWWPQLLVWTTVLAAVLSALVLTHRW
jgi:hypothetical protein